VDAPDKNRYEALDSGELIGVLDYRREGNQIMLDHVEVVPAQRGKGIGELLVSAAVNEARADGVQVVPVCPFAVAWLKAHDS